MVVPGSLGASGRARRVGRAFSLFMVAVAVRDLFIQWLLHEVVASPYYGLVVLLDDAVSGLVWITFRTSMFLLFVRFCCLLKFFNFFLFLLLLTALVLGNLLELLLNL